MVLEVVYDLPPGVGFLLLEEEVSPLTRADWSALHGLRGAA